VQERFAWLEDKNVRDIAGHKPQHPVSVNLPLCGRYSNEACTLACSSAKMMPLGLT
jgi:hypothetical protein